MNWLVCWYVAVCVNTECPDYKPDPYTGQMPNAHCAVYHSKTEKYAKTKWFGTKIEADDFIKAAPPYIKKRMTIVDATDSKDDAGNSPFPLMFSAPVTFTTGTLTTEQEKK